MYADRKHVGHCIQKLRSMFNTPERATQRKSLAAPSKAASACAHFAFAGSTGNRQFFCSFKSSACTTQQGPVPLPSRCFLLTAQI